MRYLFILSVLLCVSCGTALPSIKPYKLDVQQGNVVTSKMLLQLRPGMTKSQVRFIMGTPLIQDSFHGNRWDYVYQMRQAGKVTEQRRVILDFENELLKSVRGDVIPAGSEQAKADEPAAPIGARVVNPVKKTEERSLIDKLKFWETEDVRAEKAAAEKAAKAKEQAEQAAKTPSVSPVEPAKAGKAQAEVKPEAVNEEPKSLLAVPIAVPGVSDSGASISAVQGVAVPGVAAESAPTKAETGPSNAPLVAPSETVAPAQALGASRLPSVPDESLPAVSDSLAAPATEAVDAPAKAAGYQSSSGMQFDRKLAFEYDEVPEPQPAGPRSGNKVPPKPKALPPESDPSYFDRMLEYIGF